MKNFITKLLTFVFIAVMIFVVTPILAAIFYVFWDYREVIITILSCVTILIVMGVVCIKLL